MELMASGMVWLAIWMGPAMGRRMEPSGLIVSLSALISGSPRTSILRVSPTWRRGRDGVGWVVRLVAGAGLGAGVLVMARAGVVGGGIFVGVGAGVGRPAALASRSAWYWRRMSTRLVVWAERGREMRQQSRIQSRVFISRLVISQKRRSLSKPNRPCLKTNALQSRCIPV
ncbi:MAG: hypothetical protein RI897_169 [Verrucomicrobiota bacterium]